MEAIQEARFYDKLNDGTVICKLCHHQCHIKENQRGRCRVRENRKGILYSLVYALLVAKNADPIEKKPLFHFLPGSKSLSISTVGCNFHCLNCQNFHISQIPHHPQRGRMPGTCFKPEDVIKSAVETTCKSISYTYVEPTIFYEFAYDCSALAKSHGIKNVFVSNGFMTSQVTRQLATVLDGINIDLKSFNSDFYKKICKACLNPVLDNIRLMHDLGVWVEVTTLVIPGFNDSNKELRQIAKFIKSVHAAIPWHVSAFHPIYKMPHGQQTPATTLQRACDIGYSEGLQFVYQGNMIDLGGENTYCPSCGTELIVRSGFSLHKNIIHNGMCNSCGRKIEGIWI